MSGDLPTVHALLEKGANMEITGPDFCRRSEMELTALHIAVRDKNVDMTMVLINAGASIVSPQDNKSWPTVLIKACEWGDIPVIRRLIAAGASPQAIFTKKHQCTERTSAMHAAIYHAHLEVVQLLLTHGFDLVDDFVSAVHPLTFAARRREFAVFDLLLQHMPPGCDTALIQASKVVIEHNLLVPLKQLLGAHAMPSPVILDLCRTACRTPHDTIVELLFDHLFVLCGDPGAMSLLDEIDLRKVRSELLRTWLCYNHYTLDFFVEACIRGDVALVQQGIDRGHDPCHEDSHTRTALHFAAAQGRASVVRLLLKAGADPNHAHATYGTALSITLEGLLAATLARKSVNEYDISYAEALCSLDDGPWSHAYEDALEFSSPSLSRRGMPFRKTVRYRASLQGYKKTIHRLVKSGARVDGASGRYGTVLTLAAFAGLDGTFDLLIAHGASVHVTGGILISPLYAAIDQSNFEIVAKILELTHVSTSRPVTFELHRACEVGSLEIIEKLLELGHDPHLQNASGQTALQISLNKIERRYPTRRDDEGLCSLEERVVHKLLDADPSATLSAHELEAALKVKNESAARKIFDRIISSRDESSFPEEIFVRLLAVAGSWSRDSGGPIQVILDKKGITSITKEMLGAAQDVQTMQLLLDHDSSYIITSATIDDVGGSKITSSRECVELLLRRNPLILPSELHIRNVLTSEGSRSRRNDKNRKNRKNRKNPHLLDLMFLRNSALHPTQEMFEIVHNSTDLKVLLAHVKPGQRIVTDSVLQSLSPQSLPNDKGCYSYDRYSQKSHREELLRLFLDFEPSAIVSPEVAEKFLVSCKLETAECLLNHHDEIVYLAPNISAMITRLSKGYCPDHYFLKIDCGCIHRRFVEMLAEHPGQYIMSDEVRETVDRLFRQHSEKPLKEIYYSFAGWTTVTNDGVEE